MANNYYDATGVLVLGTVTPVITALFGDFDMDPSTPGNGEVYIARISESTEPSWDDITENLEELAESFGFRLQGGIAAEIEPLLAALATHFGVSDDPLIRRLIDEYDFDVQVDMAILYALAQLFDDGHGLAALKMEGCWHSSQPRLFEFGGNGSYYGKHVSMFTSSSDALSMGTALDKALASGDVDAAAKVVQDELEDILSSVNNDAVRQKLRERLAAALA